MLEQLIANIQNKLADRLNELERLGEHNYTKEEALSELEEDLKKLDTTFPGESMFLYHTSEELIELIRAAYTQVINDMFEE